jgi:hypothetical protein
MSTHDSDTVNAGTVLLALLSIGALMLLAVALARC